MTVAQWVLEEEEALLNNNPAMSTKQVFLALNQGVIASFAYELRRIGELHWDERIDDNEAERLKNEVRKNRNDDTQAVFAWYDWVTDGRPE